MDRMLSEGAVVALHTEVDRLLERIGNGAGRPLLARAADKRAEVERLLRVRAPFYSRAHHTIDTSGRAPSVVVTAILSALGLT
jgi:shikimate kinase